MQQIIIKYLPYLYLHFIKFILLEVTNILNSQLKLISIILLKLLYQVINNSKLLIYNNFIKINLMNHLMNMLLIFILKFIIYPNFVIKFQIKFIIIHDNLYSIHYFYLLYIKYLIFRLINYISQVFPKF